MSSKQKNQHIKVFARVRPRNSLELRSQIVVECTGNKDIAVKDKGQTKNFNFDRVFGPESKQVDVYKAVVAPLITEVLQGYNCTVFAYGQTGTGKTFTMVGDKTKEQAGGWQNDPLSGIVPRTLDHLFDELKVRAEEFTVRISFLELYNEELCDLLAAPDNDDSKTLRLYEDSMKKGSVIVSGLEERTVYEKNDVYPILEAGSLRRQTAPTLMNASSSRSHTIFTITVHVKVTNPDGEDLFKTGKLNLVDLAGSENIGRSGAVDMRAREAGNINQSLLTLGRVITSLVERTPHVPYRESKLTRILQDSLGGRTKTSIIATVSPAMCNLEETLSTFDYAHRARNITNKPEINQKMSKQVLLKNYTDEIERLRRDLMAAREKHGVYMLNEDYNGMISQIDNLNKDLVSKIHLLKVREDELAKQEDIMTSLNMNLFEAKSDLARQQEILTIKEEALKERERAFQELKNQAQVLLNTADEATEDSKKLHDRLERARMVQNHNVELVDKFKSRFVNKLQAMKQSTQAFQSRSKDLTEGLEKLNDSRSKGCRHHQQLTSENIDKFVQGLNALLPHLVSSLTNQIENTKPSLEKTTHDITKLGGDLGSLGDVLTAIVVKWLESCDPAWATIIDKLNSNLSTLKSATTSVQEAQVCAKQSSAAIQRLPQELEHAAKEEEQVLNEMKMKISLLSREMDEIRVERAALKERKQKAREAQMVIEEALVEQEARVKHARETAAEAVTMAAQSQHNQLISMLTALANLTTLAENECEKSIIPAVGNVKEEMMAETGKLQGVFTAQLKDSQIKCENIAHVQNNEITLLAEAQVVSQKAETDLMDLKESFNNKTEQMAKEEDVRLTACDNTTLAAYRQLGNEISDFCAQTFANIHDRTVELKDHKEQYRKDEKTGYTPQRKDFQYPKRLVTTGQYNESKENIAPQPLHDRSQNESMEVLK